MQTNENTPKAILERLGIQQLNDMQKDMSKNYVKNQDIVLLSPTGSGKTIAFLLPLLQQLNPNKKEQIQALILSPSRELALQITTVFRNMKTGFKVNCCYGGHDLKTELNNLQNPPALLVGTPGRIADHLRRESFDPRSITTLVLDEFDKSLEFGFSKEMSAIIDALELLQKRVLTSATAAVKIPNFVGLKNAIQLDFIKAAPSGDLSTKALACLQENKAEVLLKLTQWVAHEPTLIFCNQRAVVEELSDTFIDAKIGHDIFHGGLEQRARESALIKFQNGTIRILITTDLAARGLDIASIKNIIHFQLPHSEEELIHRNGRTARMHASGTAYLLLAEDKPRRSYLDESLEYVTIPEDLPALPESLWETLYISAGKKDKINKFDIVGTCFKKGQLNKEELGLVVVKEHAAYVAVKKTKAKQVIKLLHKQQIKKKRVVVEIAH